GPTHVDYSGRSQTVLYCRHTSFHLTPLFTFNAPATTEFSTLSLHDALPILEPPRSLWSGTGLKFPEAPHLYRRGDYWYLLIAEGDRKSTRLNSSHEWISYAVFCLKKKTIMQTTTTSRCLAEDVTENTSDPVLWRVTSCPELRPASVRSKPTMAGRRFTESVT